MLKNCIRFYALKWSETMVILFKVCYNISTTVIMVSKVFMVYGIVIIWR